MPLFPFNDLSYGNGQEFVDMAMALVSVALVIGTVDRSRVVMLIAVAANVSWLALQIGSWWVPYLFGASPQWARVYAYWFGRTWRFLPAIGNNPVPDAAHVTLHVLLGVAALFTFRAWMTTRQSGTTAIAETNS